MLRGSTSSSAEKSGTWKKRRSLSSLTERLHEGELRVRADKRTQTGREERGYRRWSWLPGPRSHWDIYYSGQGSIGRTFGPNQIGSDRGPDCPHSI